MTLERQKKSNATTAGETIPQPVPTQALEIPLRKDDPINSRNSPTTLNILTCSSDREDFANRYVIQPKVCNLHYLLGQSDGIPLQ